MFMEWMGEWMNTLSLFSQGSMLHVQPFLSKIRAVPGKQCWGALNGLWSIWEHNCRARKMMAIIRYPNILFLLFLSSRACKLEVWRLRIIYVTFTWILSLSLSWWLADISAISKPLNTLQRILIKQWSSLECNFHEGIFGENSSLIFVD